MLPAQYQCVLGLQLLQNTALNPLASVGCTATGHGQKNNKTIAGATSEAVTRWLHHRYDPIKLPIVEAYRFAMQHLVKP